MISVMFATSINGVIGTEDGSRLPWHIPEDLKRFKEVTMNASIIMGRRTYESLPKPLVGRKMLVVTSSDLGDNAPETASSLKEALDKLKDKENIFIVGGAKLIEEGLNYADKVYATFVGIMIPKGVFLDIDLINDKLEEDFVVAKAETITVGMLKDETGVSAPFSYSNVVFAHKKYRSEDD